MNMKDFQKRTEILDDLQILIEREKENMFPNFNLLILADALIFLLRKMDVKK